MIKNTFKKNIKPIVYGGVDGIITTFAVAAGFSGANTSINTLPYLVVLLFGLANLFADATSMGISSYLSERSGKKEDHAITKSFFTFASFIAFGLIPLIPYFFIQNPSTFKYSITLTFVALSLLGIIRASTTKQMVISAVLEVIILGGISAIVAYIVGSLFRGVI